MSGPRDDPAVLDRRSMIRGRPVRYLERGAGRPVILVHGLGLSADLWEPQLGTIAAAGYRVLAPDLPGFGGSAGAWTGLAVDETAEWLVRFADATGARSAAWIGHSISVQPLLRLAARHPDRAHALVLAGPTGHGHGITRVLRQLTGLSVDALREPPALVRSVLRRYLRNPLVTTATWLRARNHDPGDDAPRVHAPVLLLLGEDDPIAREAFARRLVARLHDGALQCVPRAAHGFAIDPRTAFAERTLAFLRRRYPPDPPVPPDDHGAA